MGTSFQQPDPNTPGARAYNQSTGLCSTVTIIITYCTLATITCCIAVNNNLFESSKAGSRMHYNESFDLVYHEYLSVAFT